MYSRLSLIALSQIALPCRLPPESLDQQKSHINLPAPCYLHTAHKSHHHSRIFAVKLGLADCPWLWDFSNYGEILNYFRRGIILIIRSASNCPKLLTYKYVCRFFNSWAKLWRVQVLKNFPSLYFIYDLHSRKYSTASFEEFRQPASN